MTPNLPPMAMSLSKTFLDRKLCDFLSQYFWLLKVNG